MKLIACIESHPDMQYLIAFAVLTDQSNPTGIESVEDEVSGEERQAIIGQTVANLVMFTDVDGQRKAVFSFGDLSVRAEGNFRLKLTLAQACVPFIIIFFTKRKKKERRIIRD